MSISRVRQRRSLTRLLPGAVDGSEFRRREAKSNCVDVVDYGVRFDRVDEECPGRRVPTPANRQSVTQSCQLRGVIDAVIDAVITSSRYL